MTTALPQKTAKPSTIIRPKTAALGQRAHTEADALLNDLREAQMLAAEYQRSLASKSNDLAILKQTLERALGDLAALQGTVTELRSERHRLAAEVMRLEWLKSKVTTLANRVIELERTEGQRQRRQTSPSGSMIEMSYHTAEPEVLVFPSQATSRRGQR